VETNLGKAKVTQKVEPSGGSQQEEGHVQKMQKRKLTSQEQDLVRLMCGQTKNKKKQQAQQEQ